ncbi:MAG: VOC family protein [Thermoplasmatota archaeon]
MRFLYVGSSDTGRDAAWYVEHAGARKVWHFKAFGAEVAALQLGPGPLVLLADHRKAGTVLPIYEVADLFTERGRLEKAGWECHDPGFETPNGPCVLLRDPSGNELALLEDRRPQAMEASYADPRNGNAVR